MESDAYKIAAKRNGKWWTYGNIKKNQWGNWSMSMKVTPELMALLEEKKGQYVNFSLFEDGKKEVTEEAQQDINKLQKAVDSDEIPF